MKNPNEPFDIELGTSGNSDQSNSLTSHEQHPQAQQQNTTAININMNDLCTTEMMKLKQEIICKIIIPHYKKDISKYFDDIEFNTLMLKIIRFVRVLLMISAPVIVITGTYYNNSVISYVGAVIGISASGIEICDRMVATINKKATIKINQLISFLGIKINVVDTTIENINDTSGDSQQQLPLRNQK